LQLTEQQLTDLQKETDFERREFQQEITKLLQDSKAQDVQKDHKLEQAR
jgi:mRNA-degrading endonuclease YafQ of YafQ-DinJ toxin-antitoxin module